MTLVVALALALASPTAATPIVEVATGDWSELPVLQNRGYDNMSSKMMRRLYEISQEGRCSLPGQAKGQLDLKLSFAAQYGPDGQLKRLVLPKLNCPEAEGILASVLLEMFRAGDYRQKGDSPLGWYRGNFGFVFAS